MIKKKVKPVTDKETEDDTKVLKKNEEDFPAMVHLAYWQCINLKTLFALLGSSPARATATPLSKIQVEEKARREAEDVKKPGKTKESADADAVMDDALSPRGRMIDQRQKRLLKLGFQ